VRANAQSGWPEARLQRHANRCGIKSRERYKQMFEVHQPSVWNFGHSHVKREFLIGETKFHCLAGTAISQVSESSQYQKEVGEERQGTKAFSSSAPCLVGLVRSESNTSVRPEVRVDQ
jgi:hypothetical protein